MSLNPLKQTFIKSDYIGSIARAANGHKEFVGGQTLQSPNGQMTMIQQSRPFSRQLATATSTGWSPDVWTPTLSTLTVGTGDEQTTVRTVMKVDNCVCMLGRAPYDFGTLSAHENQVLSGEVFAMIQHPIWGNTWYDVSAVLSCTGDWTGMNQLDNNFSILPLYKVTPTQMIDYRAIPTLTFYA